MGLRSDGSAIVIETDRDVHGIGRDVEARDRRRFAELTTTLARLARVVVPLLTSPPPAIDAPSLGDLVTLASAGRRFRALGRRDGYRLAQWAPMPVADLASDWLDDGLLRALVAARGVFGRFAGPRSAGTAFELILQAARTGSVMAGPPVPARPADAPRLALAQVAARAGVNVRTGTEVQQVLIEAGRAVGVRLAGEVIEAGVVVSNADPARTLLSLVDAAWLPPEFVGDVQKFRSDGVVAKVHLALSGLPRFTALESLGHDERDRLLGGRLHIGATLDDLERAFDAAKYGGFSPRPYLELTIPSLRDASLAPVGHHVLSAHVQFAPRHLRARTWEAARDDLAATVIHTIESYAPGLQSLVVGQQVLSPEDLESRYGLTGGHIYHGEHALDQLFVMRPVYGWANYRTPVRGLYLCGAGTHPGGGVHGACGYNAANTVLRDLRDGNA